MKGHDNLGAEDMARVRKFLKGLGPYQSDVWSDASYSEILEFLNERDAVRGKAQREAPSPQGKTDPSASSL